MSEIYNWSCLNVPQVLYIWNVSLFILNIIYIHFGITTYFANCCNYPTCYTFGIVVDLKTAVHFWVLPDPLCAKVVFNAYRIMTSSYNEQKHTWQDGQQENV